MLKLLYLLFFGIPYKHYYTLQDKQLYCIRCGDFKNAECNHKYKILDEAESSYFYILQCTICGNLEKKEFN